MQDILFVWESIKKLKIKFLNDQTGFKMADKKMYTCMLKIVTLKVAVILSNSLWNPCAL